jgi:hypothetical protein
MFILVGLVLALLALGLIYEKSFYAHRGDTQVIVRFLGFTNTQDSQVNRYAVFLISNASPWSVEHGPYPNRYVRTTSGTVGRPFIQTFRYGDKFAEGSKLLQRNETELVLVHIDRKRKGDEAWKLQFRCARHRDWLVFHIFRIRLLIGAWPINGRPLSSCTAETDWIPD